MLFEMESIGYEFFIILRGRVGVFLRLPFEEGDEEKKKLVLEGQDLPFEQKTEERSKSVFEGVPASPPIKHSLVVRKLDGYHVVHRTVLLKEVNRIGDGSSFGEAALIPGKSALRNASILCVENSYFAVLDKANYERIIGEHQQKSMNEKLLFFKRFFLFSVMPDDTIKTILPLMDQRFYSYRHCLFKQGEQVNTVYFIRSGYVRVDFPHLDY